MVLGPHTNRSAVALCKRAPRTLTT
jgi:hypothetical protein